MTLRLIIASAFIQLLFISSSLSCTTFVLKEKGELVYGRNFDFFTGNAFIVNNQRDISKYAFVGSEKNIMTWTSRYGSTTFNHFGKEFPYGGMNETGLVVTLMYLGNAKYPERDDRKAISMLQWIQYQLDVHSSVEEVIQSDTVLRITDEMPLGLHYLVCDAAGNTASIEFIEGKMVYHTDETLPIPLLGNSTYDESIAYLNQFDVMGGDRSVPWHKINEIGPTASSTEACNKVVATAANTMKYGRKDIPLVDQAFEVLSSVTAEGQTQWSTVFDIKNRSIHFKNAARKEVMTLNFKDFDYGATDVVKILDIQSATADHTTEQFVDYTTDLNRDYLFQAYKPLIENGFIPVKIPDEAIEAQARFPETCKRNTRNTSIAIHP